MEQEQSSSLVRHGQAAPLSVFINYRQADASSAAGRLYDHLIPELGEKNVFLDVFVLKPGMDWRRTADASVKSSGVLLAVIGPHWLSALHERGQLAAAQGREDDIARKEIEDALTNMVDVRVVPVLVDGASMPRKYELPNSLQALADQQGQALRADTYKDDVARLIEHLRSLVSVGPPRGPSPPTADGHRSPVEIPSDAPPKYRTVAENIVGRDQVVVMLGSGVNESCSKVPDASTLAAALARQYGYRSDSARVDLAEVAQYIYATEGEMPLYNALQENLTAECEVGEVHTFLAQLPRITEQMGYPRQHQLLVTTNYDTLLEEAFREAEEPFDLAVYVASGGDRGKFVHVPWGDTPEVIRTPNTYSKLPFHQNFELWRTLIVKVHGAVDTPPWQNNFVVTEDNYIDYLSGGSIEELVPVQMLARLRRSHCLFVGYDIREWSLRVFLKRVWGAQMRARSWAVREPPDELEEELWTKAGVKLIDESVDEYIEGLRGCLKPPA